MPKSRTSNRDNDGFPRSIRPSGLGSEPAGNQLSGPVRGAPNLLAQP